MLSIKDKKDILGYIDYVAEMTNSDFRRLEKSFQYSGYIPNWEHPSFWLLLAFDAVERIEGGEKKDKIKNLIKESIKDMECYKIFIQSLEKQFK